MLASLGNPSSSSNTSATVVSDALLSETVTTIVLFAGCAIAAGLGGFVGTTAMKLSDRARFGSALMWTAIGLLLVSVHFMRYEGSHPDLIVTLPIAGALGGFLQSFVTPGAVVSQRMMRALVWMLIWAAAFATVRFVAVTAVYLLYGGVTDLFAAAGARALIGGLIGTFLGGYLAGYVMGAIASFSPGIEWAPRTRRT